MPNPGAEGLLYSNRRESRFFSIGASELDSPDDATRPALDALRLTAQGEGHIIQRSPPIAAPPAIGVPDALRRFLWFPTETLTHRLGTERTSPHRTIWSLAIGALPRVRDDTAVWRDLLSWKTCTRSLADTNSPIRNAR
jgi:hypothetical protein